MLPRSVLPRCRRLLASPRASIDSRSIGDCGAWKTSLRSIEARLGKLEAAVGEPDALASRHGLAGEVGDLEATIRYNKTEALNDVSAAESRLQSLILWLEDRVRRLEAPR